MYENVSRTPSHFLHRLFTPFDVKEIDKIVNDLQRYFRPFTPFTQKGQAPKNGKMTMIPEFIRYTDLFRDWLQLLNFEPSTIQYAPSKTAEFFEWLETRRITTLEQADQRVITAYFEHLKTRQNKRKGGLLGKNYLRTHVTALRKFSRYLRETGQGGFDVEVSLPAAGSKPVVYFTVAEVQSLYRACENDIFGLRDRAILAVYYGCGLRRSEGAHLNVDDILLNKNLLHVRKGKNYKERYVPMSEHVREDIQNYIDFARPVLTARATAALFLNKDGQRLSNSSMAHRLQILKKRAGIEKQAGLHALRHSIATHLLRSGMEAVQIQRFLGHSSLESTQIYTHIANEETD